MTTDSGSRNSYAYSLCFTAVGKTSVVMRCVRDMFDKDVGSTIGAAFFTYKMQVLLVNLR